MTYYTDRRDAITGKARAITKKVTDIKQKILAALGGNFNLKLKADIDAAIKVILDDSFLKVIDKAVVALDNTINQTSQELQELVKQVFENLSNLEKQVEQLIDKFFQNISETIKDIRTNLVDPMLDAISNLEKQFFKDINQVLDKVFNFFEGTVEEFKIDLMQNFGWLVIPNPGDPCRKKYQLEFKLGPQLTDIDVFNLFECGQLKRLDDSSTTTVKKIKEIYSTLERQSFKMTCLGRGSPSFQELYLKKWLDYRQLFEIWNGFMDDMTPQEAYDEAIRRLNQARDEYQARVADINLAPQTADDAVIKANAAQVSIDTLKTATNDLVNSTVLKEFTTRVGFKIVGEYHIFVFPNLYAKDFRAHGQFYSSNSLVSRFGLDTKPDYQDPWA
jgi:hypothetical protein